MGCKAAEVFFRVQLGSILAVKGASSLSLLCDNKQKAYGYNSRESKKCESLAKKCPLHSKTKTEKSWEIAELLISIK